MASTETSRKPDYRLGLIDKATDERGNGLGSAWKNEDGSISIKLQPSVCLTNQHLIRLWPADEPLGDRVGKVTPKTKVKRKTGPYAAAPFDDMDDDIPF